MASKNVIMYWNKLCPFVQRSWITAVEKGAENISYEYIPLNGVDMPEDFVKNINPRGTLPALKLSSGKILHESLPIAEYIDATYGAKNALTSTDPLIRARISAFNAQIGELIGALYTFLFENTEENRKNAIENLKYAETLFNAHTKEGPFFLGSTFSMADVTIAPFFIRFNTTLKAYNNFDLAKEAPWADALRRASLQRHSVASTTPAPEFFIDGYKGYLQRDAPHWPKAKLYYASTCPFAHRARIAAAVKNLDKYIEHVEVSFPLPDWYEAEVNPAGTVPCLVTAEGELVQESNVIVDYINNAYKGVGADILPEDEEQVCEAKLFISEFGNFQGGVIQFLRPKPGDDAKAKALASLKDDGKYIENLIAETSKNGPWVLGETFSFADAVALPLLVRIDAATGDERLTAGYDFFAEHPRLAKLLAAGKADANIAATIVDAEIYRNGLKGFLDA